VSTVVFPNTRLDAAVKIKEINLCNVRRLYPRP
jgi:hypothetical protein